jgi:2-(3-amino-3-carboxypropyl)histidine synthase
MKVKEMKVFLQVPEGLKTKVLEIAKELAEKGYEVFISCEPCYGACDLRIKEAELLNCKKIIHFAHSKFIDSKIPVEYKEMKEEMKLKEIHKHLLEKIPWNKIGLVTSLQFVNLLEDVKRVLEEKGKTVFIGKGKRGERILYPGQILGCDYSQAKEIENSVECFLFVGSGKFHPIGLKMITEKPVFFLDLEKNELKEINVERFLKQKLVAQELAKDCKKIGIIISTKPGQLKVEIAERLKQKIEAMGKKAWLLVVDEIKPEKFEGLDIDCFVNTACPRVVIEERTFFKKPILNWYEFEEMLEKNSIY